MKKKYILMLIILLPSLTFASEGVDQMITTFSGWLNGIAKIIIGLTVIAIFWGLFNMIFNYDKKADEGKSIMLWGIIALFVMASIWGLVHFLQGSTNIKSDSAPDIKKLLPQT